MLQRNKLSPKLLMCAFRNIAEHKALKSCSDKIVWCQIRCREGEAFSTNCCNVSFKTATGTTPLITLLHCFLFFFFPDRFKFYERWTNDTLKKRVADNRQSYEMPVLFAAVYHITVVEVLEDGKSERFYDVSVHRDRNKRLTVIAFTNVRGHSFGLHFYWWFDPMDGFHLFAFLDAFACKSTRTCEHLTPLYSLVESLEL